MIPNILCLFACSTYEIGNRKIDANNSYNTTVKLVTERLLDKTL